MKSMFEKPVILSILFTICLLEILQFFKQSFKYSDKTKHFHFFSCTTQKSELHSKILSMQSASFLGACVSLSLLRRLYIFLQKHHLYWPICLRVSKILSIKVNIQTAVLKVSLKNKNGFVFRTLKVTPKGPLLHMNHTQPKKFLET